jgi:hypothetical protein
MSKSQVDSLFDGFGFAGVSSASAPSGEEDQDVSDEYFFRKFPIDRLDSLDVVEGFGGTIIQDLNEPIPDSLLGEFDFILDGGTFDHLVNVGIAFQSVIKMLKPGGRIFHYNAASGYMGRAYVSFGPDLFYDYYAVNGFSDCKIYIARSTATSKQPTTPWELFHLRDVHTRDLNQPGRQMVIAIAEKGSDSVWHRVPIEQAWRTPQLREEFAEYERDIAKSPRPIISAEPNRTGSMREAFRAWRYEWAHIQKRRRKGKFSFRRHRKQRSVTRPYITYTYLGQL